jgi:hypothetical protein
LVSIGITNDRHNNQGFVANIINQQGQTVGDSATFEGMDIWIKLT